MPTTDKLNLLQPAKKIGVSLEPWAFFVNIFVCEIEQKYGGRESSTRCNFRKHMQIEKAPANQENIFIILTADGANAHNKNK